jgi:NADH-quinone oxidoreductase subunit L
MNINILFLTPVVLPLILAIISLVIPNNVKKIRELVAILGTGIILIVSFILFTIKDAVIVVPWLMPGIEFDMRLYQFSAFISLWINIFVFLVTLYSSVKMAGDKRVNEYYGYLMLTAGFANGAVFANNFVLLLTFWGGLLLTLYALISVGGKPTSTKTAQKSFILLGICDFCLLLGIALIYHLTGNLKMSEISIRPEGYLATTAFVLLMIGAIGKGGSMPFHNWIPDAATDAPVTVMAMVPASLEKLLGIYLLTRISLDFFQLSLNHPLCILMMIIGSCTIVFAVMMALVQKEFKRLLSYHAVSQVGYMILGVGTAVPIAIAGGLFHMLNNAIYKSGLFLSAGAVEQQTGTTDLKKLGGLAKQMPITATCFVILAAAISGIWPLNGFVSKEMIFHGTLETGYTIFTVMAWFGAIFTFVSFLKLGHSVFFGPRSTEVSPAIQETKSPVFIPMVVLAFLSILFGVFYKLPMKLFIQPVIAGYSGGTPEQWEVFNHSMEHSLNVFTPVAMISILMLVIGLLIHYFGWKRAGMKASQASEMVHNLPVIHKIYDLAENRVFDFYEQGVKILKWFAAVLYYGIDRIIDFVYEKVITVTGKIFSRILSFMHNGSYANYVAWCVIGLLIIIETINYLLK